MCWYGKQKDRKIADKDIECYKFISKNLDTGQYTAFFQTKHIYELGKEYKANIQPRLELDRWVTIESGLHCYASYVQITPIIKQRTYSVKYNTLLTTYHTHVMVDPMVRTVPILVECVMPKGTEYWENVNGEMVAEKLKLIREL